MENMERTSKEVNVHFTALLDKKTTLQIENTKIQALTFHPASLTAQPKNAFHQTGTEMLHTTKHHHFDSKYNND